MAEAGGREQLAGYLAAQSAKLPAGEIGRRLDEAARAFVAAVRAVDEAVAHRAPAAGEWSVAEVVDHVTLTLEEVTAIMGTLAAGRRPARTMTVAAAPVNGARPLAELVARLERAQAAAAAFLAAQGDEPHTDLRVADHDFGEINWKGYALILRLHYRDHTEQVRKTLAAVRP
jgi:hypothetical protein